MLSLGDVAIGAVPALAWLLWIHRKDDHDPEPVMLVLTVFALGGLAAVLQVWLRPRVEFLLLSSGLDLRDRLLDAFVATAACEEAVKTLAIVAGALWHTRWDEPLDGIIYGAAAGLGFAAVENAYFLAVYEDLGLIAQRSFTATLAHVTFSAGVGFGLGLARLRPGQRGRWVLAGLAYAILLHGLYDYLLLDAHLHLAALLGALPLLLLCLALKIRWARRRSPLYHPAA